MPVMGSRKEALDQNNHLASAGLYGSGIEVVVLI
jgi:hypothetical protein